MLSRLYIENFALIPKLTLEFSPKLNVLTGETGAGKTILIDALRFVLGERMDGERLGSGDSASCVEAVFEIKSKDLMRNPAIENYLGEDSESTLILRRERLAQGKTRCLINDRTATTAALKEIGSLLVDIHGQYDHQLLLNKNYHLPVLDRLAKVDGEKAAYRQLFAEYDALIKQKEEIRQASEGRERELDLLKYQVDEIEKADLRDANEDDELRHEQIKMNNSEKLHELLAKVLNKLNDDEVSASNLMAGAFRDMSQLAKLDPSLEELKSQYETVQLNFEEMLRALQDYQTELSYDEDRMAEIEKRLDVFDLLKRKYGGSLPKVMEFFEEAKKKYDQMLNSGVYTKEIEEKIKKLLPGIKKVAEELTEKRKKSAISLKKTIEQELKDLSIADAEFQCQMQKIDFDANGQDSAEFLIRLNFGSPLMPLEKIISGGEVSRVMLALKKALMKVDPVETLIFDEIDANIGGRLGSVTGEKLQEIGEERQVLLITHLPQIASFADRHFKVAKTVKQGKTVTDYRVIEGEERVRELAQMMSGKDETKISKEHAKEMLNRVGRA